MKCPEMLARLEREGDPDDPGRPLSPELQAHLEACPDCARQVSRLQAVDRLLEDSLGSLPPPPATLPEVILARLAAQQAEASRTPAPPGWRDQFRELLGGRGWVLALAGAAAALLLVLLPREGGNRGSEPGSPWGALGVGNQVLEVASGELLPPGLRPPQESWLEAVEGVELEWPEGCGARLQGGSLFRLGEARLDLREGLLEWSGHPRQEFRVTGGGAEVRVVGTRFRFRVSRGDPAAELVVVEGQVQLVHAGRQQSVSAGEEWTPAAPAAPSPPPEPAHRVPPLPSGVDPDSHLSGGGFTVGQ